MRTPTDFEMSQLLHMYDPVKAREYYLRTRELKGRRRGRAERPTVVRAPAGREPRTGRSRAQIQKEARAKQRKELGEKIDRMEKFLKKLEAKIAERIRDEQAENRKSKAKKERAAKERDKPKTAAEKAEEAREAKKYRDKNQQKLKADAKKDASTSGGGSKSKKGDLSKRSTDDLKAKAAKVRGQIAVAKQKLAAL